MASGVDPNYTSATENGSQSLENQIDEPHKSIVEDMDIASTFREDSINKSDGIEDTSDDQDSRGFGRVKTGSDRPDAMMPVSRSSTHYNMKHLKRGHAIIIAYSKFDFSEDVLKPRDCADYDANICEVSFKMLGYDVKTYKNLRKAEFLQLLEYVSKMNHSDFDSLVFIFMSHGGVHVKNNQEYIWTYDSKVNTSELWRNFTPEKCPSLAGKPKLFFIQACRGKQCNKGVQLKKPEGLGVQTDGINQSKRDKLGLEDYAIPLHADMLMMYASYTGMFAFKSRNNGLNGSVFIHFLSLVLKEDFKKHDLYTMLLRVTREVATEYESYNLQHPDKHESKQIPQMGSWFYQIGFLLYPPVGEPWKEHDHNQMMMATLFFTWHNAAIFTMMVITGSVIYLKVKRLPATDVYERLHPHFPRLVKLDEEQVMNIIAESDEEDP